MLPYMMLVAENASVEEENWQTVRGSERISWTWLSWNDAVTSERWRQHQQLSHLRVNMTSWLAFMRNCFSLESIMETSSYHGIVGTFWHMRISCVKLTVVLQCLTGTGAWILTVPSLQTCGTLISASTQEWEEMEIHHVLLLGPLPPQDGSWLLKQIMTACVAASTE